MQHARRRKPAGLEFSNQPARITMHHHRGGVFSFYGCCSLADGVAVCEENKEEKAGKEGNSGGGADAGDVVRTTGADEGEAGASSMGFKSEARWEAVRRSRRSRTSPIVPYMVKLSKFLIGNIKRT